MTAEKFKILVDTIRSAYPGKGFLNDESSKKLWFGLLSDMDYKTAAYNLKRHITTNKFPPSIAEIRGEADAKDFNNFQRRRYDMDKLEAALLGANKALLTDRPGKMID